MIQEGKNEVALLWSNPTCNKSLTLSPVQHLPDLRIRSRCGQLCWLSQNDLCSHGAAGICRKWRAFGLMPMGVMTLHTWACSVNVNDRWIIYAPVVTGFLYTGKWSSSLSGLSPCSQLFYIIPIIPFSGKSDILLNSKTNERCFLFFCFLSAFQLPLFSLSCPPWVCVCVSV